MTARTTSPFRPHAEAVEPGHEPVKRIAVEDPKRARGITAKCQHPDTGSIVSTNGRHSIGVEYGW